MMITPRITAIGLAITTSLALTACSLTTQEPDGYHFKRSGDPLVKHIFTADPSARVFNDRLYVYTSHDRADTDESKHFDMVDWHVFSTKNMEDWVDHGVIFSLDDISWASQKAWAPDAIERNGKYYFYYPVEQAKIGVAVGDTPYGPFKDPINKPLIDKTGQVALIGKEPIDPTLLVDDDGQAYMYFGCREPKVVKLKENMVELDGSVQELKFTGIEGFQSGEGGWYGEGPWIFKRNGLYYLMYSNGWGKKSTLVYATSQQPMGPFEYQGEVIASNIKGTKHGSIAQYKNKWYLFYHNYKLSGGNNKKRSVTFTEIKFDENGKISSL